MGIDVNLYAVGDITDKQLEDANRYLAERRIFGWGEDLKENGPALVRDKYAEDGRVEWDTPIRYYGPGYERGHWPDIYNAIVCIRAALPQCTIHYGGDTSLDAPEVTNPMLAEMWAHWVGPEGTAYRLPSLTSTGDPS